MGNQTRNERANKGRPHSGRADGLSVSIIGTRGYPSFYGGFETAVRHLAPYLADMGWGVTVYGRGEAISSQSDADKRIKSQITWGLERKSLSTLSYGATATLHSALRKPDVALVMNVANGFFLPALKLRKIPSLVNVDGIEWDRDKWGRLAKATFHQGAKSTAKYATNLVFDANAIGDRWRDEFGRDGVFIPYGGNAPNELPIEPGLKHRGYVLMVARLVPENSVDVFLKAAEDVSRDYPVVIVGSSGYGGIMDDKVADLQRRNQNVTWLGHVSDDSRLLSLWQHAGAYFHGHSVGGTNPALVQAMACGAPVVARDTVYNREVLGGAGVLVQPDAASISNSLRLLLGDSKEQDRLSAAVIARASLDYTWEKVCHAYHSELLRLAT